MTPAIDDRELISISVSGLNLRGTYHRVPGEKPPGNTRSALPALLFLNHGFLPRSAPGDSAAFLCKHLARSGYPCFRFDLQGLGDSDGIAPTPLFDFINAGGYASSVAALTKALAERFGFSQIVIVGHCAGAVTALFAAPNLKECAGLVLTDPYFFLPRDRTKLRMGLGHWSAWSRVGAAVSSAYYFLRHVGLLMRRNRPPRNANLPLLHCWNQVSSAGLPMLVLKAPALKARGLKPRMGEFDYLAYLQSRTTSRNCVSIQFIEGTNHSFADRKGREAVREQLDQWLTAHFIESAKGGAAQRPVPRTGAYEAVLPG